MRDPQHDPRKAVTSRRCMIEFERFDDVTRVRLASWGSRTAALDVSVYLVRGVLVDSGFPRARAAIARLLDETKIAGAMLTHWHEDHAGNAELLAALGAKIAYMEETIAAIETKLDAGWSDRVIVKEILGGEEIVARLSGGEYARGNFVRAIRKERKGR